MFGLGMKMIYSSLIDRNKQQFNFTFFSKIFTSNLVITYYKLKRIHPIYIVLR